MNNKQKENCEVNQLFESKYVIFSSKYLKIGSMVFFCFMYDLFCVDLKLSANDLLPGQSLQSVADVLWEAIQKQFGRDRLTSTTTESAYEQCDENCNAQKIHER